jgi:hypothetical protein
MRRAALFAFVGVLFFVPGNGHELSESEMSDWNNVLAFSAALLALAFALPMFAQLAGDHGALRVSRVPAAGAALCSLANIFEDGLQMGWAFLAFVLGAAILSFGLLALMVVIARAGHGSRRLLALVPAGTLAAITFYASGGGILMLATWLAAAAIALVLPRRTAALAS